MLCNERHIMQMLRIVTAKSNICLRMIKGNIQAAGIYSRISSAQSKELFYVPPCTILARSHVPQHP
jgi:hypothetical protein